MTPSFFINGRHYYGSWDEAELADALVGSLGHRMRVRALQFASWAPSAGVLLVLASVLAVAITNSPLGPGLTALWDTGVSLGFGNARFSLPLVGLINAGLPPLFFLVDEQ